MENKSIGFIGAGRITGILLQALQNEAISFAKVVVFDIDAETTGRLRQRFPQILAAGLEQVAVQDIVVVALHPPVIMETLEKIRTLLIPECVLISLAPKIKVDKIREILQGPVKVIRLIPNATSVINEGYNPVCFSPGFPEDEKQQFIQLLGNLGETFEVEESRLEAYAVISAMAPTYFWFQWQKLAEIGEQIGLDKQESARAVHRSLVAALNTLFTTGLSPEEVFDLIPVKPIGEHEDEISGIYEQKLKDLYAKLSS